MVSISTNHLLRRIKRSDSLKATVLLKVFSVHVTALYWNIFLLLSIIYFQKRHVQIHHVLMAVHVLYLTVVISVHVWLDLQVHNVKVQLFSTALSYYTIRSSTFFDYLCAILCSFFNNNNNDKNKNNNNISNNNNNSTTCIWYEHDPKCTHFSVSIFIQLLTRCFISLRGEIWSHRTSFKRLRIPKWR
jgi:hypothetical protein